MEYSIAYDLDYEDRSTWQVISATAFCKASLVYATDIGHFYANKNYFTERKGLNSYLIKFAVSGAANLHYNNQTYHIKPGQIFWMDCNQPHRYGTDAEVGNWDVMWFHFAGATAKAYYCQYLKNTNNCPVATLPLNSPVLKLMQELEALYASPMTQLDKDIQASGLITQIMVACVGATSHTNDNVPEVVREIQNYLQTHYTQKITLSDLSAMFNLNQFYLQKLFKRYVGQSPSEYMVHLRLTKAKELLLTTHLSISEISYAVGIENTSHFTRQFKAQEGITPQDFRKIWPTV